MDRQSKFRTGRVEPALLALLVLSAATSFAADPAVEALALYRAGKCSQAEPLLRDLISKQPKNVAAHKLLAGCLVQLHRASDARGEYQTVLKIAPGDPDATRALQPALATREPPAAPRPTPSAEAVERARAGQALEVAEKLIAAGRLDEAAAAL